MRFSEIHWAIDTELFLIELGGEEELIDTNAPYSYLAMKKYNNYRVVSIKPFSDVCIKVVLEDR